ncbi:MAG: PHP domain-containing protein, partial [Clostridia bacterium]|nr:PHP domain-containing protein [Clostridia bacterium]
MKAKEIKKQLAKQYPYRIELHAHTKPVSGCSEILPEEMAEIYHKKGFDAVVITNHFVPWVVGETPKEEVLDNYLSGYEETAKAAEKYGIKVFLGVEIRFSENNNDYLLFGVDREVLSVCYDYLHKGV